MEQTTLKKPWYRKSENIIGAPVVGLALAALGVYLAIHVLPFVILAAANTIYAALLLGGLAALTFVALDKDVHTALYYGWKSATRAIGYAIVNQDPIGVIETSIKIMRKGYRLSFDFDVNNYEASDVTKSFIHSMRKIFKTKDNAFQAGALLAFESVSIPEFYVLDSLVEKCETHLHTPKRNEYTADYIKGHKQFEIGHKEGLLQAIEEYIQVDQSTDFASGYLAVCVMMSNWWNGLSDSITFNR